MDKLLKTDIVVARLLVVCVFLPQQIQVVATIGSCIYFVARTIAAKVLPTKNSYLAALSLGSLYLLYFIAAIISPAEHRATAFGFCERMASFLLLPLVFAIVAPNFRQLIAGQLRYFVYGCLILCALGNAHYLYQHFISGGGKEAVSHVRYRMTFEPFTGIHPTYMSLYLGFAICITAIIWNPVTKRDRILKSVFLYTLLLFLLALFSKSPIIALGIIAIHFLYTQRSKLYDLKWIFVTFGAFIIAAYAFIPFFRQRLGEALQFSGIGAKGTSADNSFYDRQMIFNTDMDILRRYWLGGVGPGALQQRLNERFFFHSIRWERAVGYFDPHNQYLSIWLSLGVVGIVVFIGIMVMQFVRAIRTGNRLYLYLLIILGVTFFTETLLQRQQGVIFYSLFTSLFFFSKAKANQE